MNEKRGDGRLGSRGEEVKEESGVIDCWSEEKDGGAHSERKYCRYKSKDRTPAIRSR